MSCSFFTANRAVKGMALFCQLDSKGGAVYFRFLKQTGWNQDTSKGTFADGDGAVLKLSGDEIAGIIRSVDKKTQFSFFHNFEGETSRGSFSYFEKDGQNKEKKPIKIQVFSLNLTKEKDRTKSEFRISFSLAAAERLKLWLLFAIDRIFQAAYAEDKRKFQERQKEFAEKNKSSDGPKRKKKDADEYLPPEDEEVEGEEQTEATQEEEDAPF